jgi:radical SAM superfamily enzyme YgiQ (UPF0313 family)
MESQDIRAILPRLLGKVAKPARYTGGELNQIVKDWEHTAVRLALLFPEIYDLGMSNLGMGILYDIVNRHPEFLAERVFLPWDDMQEAMRREGVPLYSLETWRPLMAFDAVGISLPYESLYTNALQALDLAGIPLRAAERNASHPLVIAGGHAAYNPEPMSEFIDAFVIGEGEEVVLEVLAEIQAAKKSAASRTDTLSRLAAVSGVYVPGLYAPEYAADGTIRAMRNLTEAAPKMIRKRMVAPLPPAPVRPIVPYLETVHDRYAIEIMRGCTRGCRFCQAGAATRPVRERPVAEVLDSIEQALIHTGYEEIALLSLSSSDYSHITELVTSLADRFGHSRLRVSLPSLRIDTVSLDLMEALRGARTSSVPEDRSSATTEEIKPEGTTPIQKTPEPKRVGTISGGGFTLAPEAATERMRSIINKPLATETLLSVAREIYRRRWTTIKLYFMIGHPNETMEDVRAIAELCYAVQAEGRREIGRRAEVHAGVSTFIPKPHTPFQWASMDALDQIRAKQDLLRRELRGPGLRLDWSNPEETMLEGWLSRGDRRLGEVIFQAWQNGARFDAWQDRFNAAAWRKAFETTGIDPMFYTHRARSASEVLPWDHISTGVRKAFLRAEYERSLQGQTLADCREECFACGIVPAFREQRNLLAEEIQFCPPAAKLERASRGTGPSSPTA